MISTPIYPADDQLSRRIPPCCPALKNNLLLFDNVMKPDPTAGIARLCPNCGLCCDSTLFADVELRAGDDPKRLKKLGLTLVPKTKTRLAFAQPCTAFDGKLCCIYHDRPKQCRLFECGMLKRVQSGDISPALALRKIAAAKRQVKTVRKILHALGQRDEQLALTHRYADAISQPIDLANHAQAGRHGQLMMAVNELMDRLERDFLQ